MLFTASLLGAQHKQAIVCRTSRQACLLVSLGKALNGMPPSLCGRQEAYPYFTGLQLRSCSPSMSLKATLGYPPAAVLLVVGGATSHSWLVQHKLPLSPSLIQLRCRREPVLPSVSYPGMWKRKRKLEAEAVEAVFFCGSGSGSGSAKNSTASAST